jgi:hypothetical protein
MIYGSIRLTYFPEEMKAKPTKVSKEANRNKDITRYGFKMKADGL